PTPTPTPRPTPTLPAVELSVWENLPEAQARRLAQEIALFQQEYPGYRIRQNHYTNPEDFMTPLMAGQTTFDLVLASPVLLGSLWKTGQLAPMSDYFGPEFLNRFVSVTVQGARRDGELWGLPDTAGFHLLLFYNKTLVDTPPATTAELAELARDLTDPRASPPRWGLALNSYDPLWVVPWLTPYGGWLVDPQGRPTLDTPAMQSALALFLGWHGIPNEAEAIAPVQTYEAARTAFVQGRSAMLIDGEWAIWELAAVSGLEWGVAPLPRLSLPDEEKPAAPLVLARYWAVNRETTGNQALAAAAFLEFITRPERQLNQTEQFGLLPTRREALTAPLITGNPVLRVNAMQMQSGRAALLGVNVDGLLNQMRGPLRRALDGELSAEAAIRAME
ncbi:MAG: extracellular solute-binding protein, partial [Chloroflexi bacterium]